MPKSRKNRVVTLSRARPKKGLKQKSQLIQEIRNCATSYPSVFVFSVENMRNSNLKEVRQHWKKSRFFFGKSKVMQLALGRTDSDEFMDGLHLISKKLVGNTGLLFTDTPQEEVLRWFESYSVPEYARSGNRASKTVTVVAGPLEQFVHSMEPGLRQLGVPIKLVKGKLHLTQDYTICKEGDILSPEQCRVLKLFSYQLVDFQVVLVACWNKEKGFEELN